jgi:hypothetical protein
MQYHYKQSPSVQQHSKTLVEFCLSYRAYPVQTTLVHVFSFFACFASRHEEIQLRALMLIFTELLKFSGVDFQPLVMKALNDVVPVLASFDDTTWITKIKYVPPIFS